MHPLNRPEWPNGQVDAYPIYLAFRDQMAEVEKLENPDFNYENKVKALLISSYPFLEGYYGQKFTTKKYDLGGGFNYLPIGNSADYADHNALHAAAISELAPEKYRPGSTFKILYFFYMTRDNKLLSKFNFSGGLNNGFGSVMYALRSLDYNTLEGKLDPDNIVTSIHEIHHTSGKGHYTGTENSINLANPVNLPYYVIAREDAEGLGDNKLESDPYLPSCKPRVYSPVTFSNKSN